MTKSQIEPKITRNSSKLRNSFIVAMDCEFFSLKTISVCILQTPAVNLCLTILFVWNETSSIISYCFHFEWVCMGLHVSFQNNKTRMAKIFSTTGAWYIAAKWILLVHFKINLLLKLPNEMMTFINEQWIDLLKGVRLNQRGYFW